MKLALLFLAITPILGVVIINHFSFATNSEVFSLSVAIKRVKGKGSVLNVTVTSFETVEKLKIYVKISLDDNSQLNGNKELVNTVFDVQKVLNGIYSNRIGRAVVDSILQRVDFVPKFPIPPGTYKVINWSADDSLISMLSSVSGQTDLRYVGKIAGRKGQIFMGNTTVKWELIRGRKVEH